MRRKTHRRKTGRGPPAASPSLLASFLRVSSSILAFSLFFDDRTQTANSRKKVSPEEERDVCEIGALFRGAPSSREQRRCLERRFSPRVYTRGCEFLARVYIRDSKSREEKEKPNNRARARTRNRDDGIGVEESALCTRALCCRVVEEGAVVLTGGSRERYVPREVRFYPAI